MLDGKSTCHKFSKKYQRDFKNIQYRLRMAVEKGDIDTILSILKSQTNPSKTKRNLEQPEFINLIDVTQDDAADKEYRNEIDVKGQDQWTLLHIAVNEGNYDVVRLLLEHRANPNSKSANQRTPLHLACMRGYYFIAEILIEYNSDINCSDMDGNTPTHLCSEFGHHDLLRYILTKRPTLYCLNYNQKSPVDVAADLEILSIFDEHLNFIKNELFNNIAQMNGINIKSQLKHQHKLSYDASIDEISDYQRRISDQNIPLTHRTKLVKVQDSICSSSDEVHP